MESHVSGYLGHNSGSVALAVYLSELPNACLTQPPRYGMRLEDGDSICLPDGDDYNYYYFHKKEAKSVAVSTGHGSGDLSLSLTLPALSGEGS